MYSVSHKLRSIDIGDKLMQYYPIYCSICNTEVKETSNEEHENLNHMPVDIV